jgi:hypothetical protein
LFPVFPSVTAFTVFRIVALKAIHFQRLLFSIWLLVETLPLTPLQPVVLNETKDFLAGEGRQIERGLCPLS